MPRGVAGWTSAVAGAGTPLLELTVSASPRVSIIVLGWRDAPSLLRCLRSLARCCDGRTPFELLLFLNAPSAELATRARLVRGARVAESPVNLGFGGGINAAAAGARGELIVLLNDDAVIEPGWLEALVNAADTQPAAGVIGSCALNWNGTIREAGGQVWRDASVTLYGKGQPAATPAFMGLRPVEFVSGCSFLVRRKLWLELGGFDERFYPAYYEDVDLCLRARAAGFDVLCEGRSRLYHGGPASLPSRLRDFIVTRNAMLLRRLWKAELDARPLPPEGVCLPWTGEIVGPDDALPNVTLDPESTASAAWRALQRDSMLYQSYAAAWEAALRARELELLAQIEHLRSWATELERRQIEREAEIASAHEQLQRWALELQERTRWLEAQVARGPTSRLRAAAKRLRRLAKV